MHADTSHDETDRLFIDDNKDRLAIIKYVLKHPRALYNKNIPSTAIIFKYSDTGSLSMREN